jgi:NADPH-dependent curcumin reductase CurA
MTTIARQVRLASRPVGLPQESTWRLTEQELPGLEEGEVLVRVTHISLDPAMRGWLNDARSYAPPVALDAVMRAIGVGTVAESRHKSFAVGDAVTGMVGVADHAVLPGERLQRVDLGRAPAPTWLGALGMPGMTAWFGLFDVAAAKPGETVLVSGAAGAVGSVAGQLAKSHGCRVVGIAGGAEKTRWLVEELGFDEAVDYKAGGIHRALRAALPDGLDVYFDNVGGEILDSALRLLRMKARIAICGGISAYNATEPVPGPAHYMSLLVNRARMEGFLVSDYAARFPEATADMLARIEAGTLVAREHVVAGPLEAFNDTFLMLFSGANTGKLVLELTPA